MVDPIGDITQLVGEITGIALSDPLSAVSILFGGLFLGASMLALGYLTVGAVVDLVTPEKSQSQSPRA